MADKRFNNKELDFTKEDREKVFKRIRKLEEEHSVKKQVHISKIVPLTFSVLIVGLCLFLFVPSLFSIEATKEVSSTDVNETDNTVGESSALEDKYFTTLFTVKDAENRIPLNLLLSYSSETNELKVLSIPRDTYAPIFNKDGTVVYDKLTFAYTNESEGAGNVRTTVSKLFDVKIDHYAVVELETFSKLIDMVNGIEYELQEDMLVRAITQVSFEFQKGKKRLNGEEIVALMMDATVERSLGEEDLVNLLEAVINKAKNEIPKTDLKVIASNYRNQRTT